MSEDLVAFLAARLDEDEQRAKEALTPGVYRWVDIHSDLEWVITQTEGDFAEALPKRVLREVAARRAILELHDGSHECPVYDHNGVIDNCGWIDEGYCPTIRHLAAVYSDHPGYRPEWAPTRTTTA